MKYKVLLTGRNNAVIDDFFTQMSEDFESVTTSTRYDDIISHFRCFKPDIFVYCLNQEMREHITRISTTKATLQKERIPFAIIGSETDCADFLQTSTIGPNLIFTKPITFTAIQERLLTFLNDKKQKEKEEALMEEVRANLAAAEDEARAAQAAAEAEAARRKHILVVDDDPMMLKMLKEHLREYYDVATAINGKVALKFLDNKKTDLILLDYEMPVENGAAVLEKLRANDATSQLPVIFLTGVTDKDKITKVLSLKPQGYLLKPIDKNMLFTSINDVFKRKNN
ncbi:MAG: response regulator [Candidatus Gastranaerophilales bacterium]|nr:response regulator [Candidatus Gastranaerophilales bacterium]